MKFWAFAALVHAANIGASNLSRDWRISMQKEIVPGVVDLFVWIEKYSPPFILTKHLVFELVVISCTFHSNLSRNHLVILRRQPFIEHNLPLCHSCAQSSISRR